MEIFKRAKKVVSFIWTKIVKFFRKLSKMIKGKDNSKERKFDFSRFVKSKADRMNLFEDIEVNDKDGERYDEAKTTNIKNDRNLKIIKIMDKKVKPYTATTQRCEINNITIKSNDGKFVITMDKVMIIDERMTQRQEDVTIDNMHKNLIGSNKDKLCKLLNLSAGNMRICTQISAESKAKIDKNSTNSNEEEDGAIMVSSVEDDDLLTTMRVRIYAYDKERIVNQSNRQVKYYITIIVVQLPLNIQSLQVKVIGSIIYYGDEPYFVVSMTKQSYSVSTYATAISVMYYKDYLPIIQFEE